MRALPRLTADPREEFTGVEIRRLTARAAAAHSHATPGQVLTDVAYAVVSVLIAAALIGGTIDALRLELAFQASAAAVDSRWVQALATAALVAAVLGLAARTGPVGVSRAGVTWWLAMPVDREGILLPSWRRAVAGWPAIGAVGGLVVAVLTGAGWPDALRGALVGASGCGLAVALAGLAQREARVSRLLVHAADALLALVPALGLLLVAVGARPPASDGWWLVLPLVVGALALGVRWRGLVPSLPGVVLRARAGAVERTHGAFLSLDTRELGRSLAGTVAAVRPRRVRSLRLVRGPRSALVVADVVLLTRSPSVLSQLVALACLVALATGIPLLASGPGLLLLVLVCGLRAGQLGAVGSRVAEMAPVLDATLPMSARWARATRCVVPVGCAVLVLAVGTAPLVARWGPWWLVLIVVVGVVLGASAVRACYRPPPDWSGPLLATPAGALPTGAVNANLKGPDTALFGCLPLGVAVVVGHVTPGLLLAQAVAASSVLLVATRVPRVRRAVASPIPDEMRVPPAD